MIMPEFIKIVEVHPQFDQLSNLHLKLLTNLAPEKAICVQIHTPDIMKKYNSDFFISKMLSMDAYRTFNCQVEFN